MNRSICIIIPCYNHGCLITALVGALLEYQIPLIIVNDGSDVETTNILNKLSSGNRLIQLFHHPSNSGKGSAVLTGIEKAEKEGYTHALQIDADGQHDITDIPRFLELSKKYPKDLISGKPVYDGSIPKSRLYSRYITHFWVWIETLSLEIKDSMCGYRVYPIAKTLELSRKTHFGHYMDFDTEVMVKLYWQGIKVRFIETKVIYPEDGVSHFRLFRDNLLISWMHIRLFFGMLLRIPNLLGRKYGK